MESEDVAEDLQGPERGDFSLLEDTGMYGVMVLSQRDEHTCSSFLDVYKLDEAKEKEHIPHSDCQNDECRCSYIPVPDEDAYRKNNQEGPDLSDLRD